MAAIMTRTAALALLPYLLIASSTATAFSADSKAPANPVVDFVETSNGPTWNVVNDGVMGGLSKGSKQIENGDLIFTGTLSLENNGGFSLVETSDSKWDFSSAEGVRLRVKGDGRTYQIRFGSDARTRGDYISYTGDFATVEGEWVERVVRFDELTPIHHGEIMEAPPINTANIEQIGIIIGDKRPGPFKIEVDWIALD